MSVKRVLILVFAAKEKVPEILDADFSGRPPNFLTSQKSHLPRGGCKKVPD